MRKSLEPRFIGLKKDYEENLEPRSTGLKKDCEETHDPSLLEPRFIRFGGKLRTTILGIEEKGL